MNEEHAYGSQEALSYRILWLRDLMLAAQKDLGALGESLPGLPWPELLDQLAELQALLADFRAELRFYHRTSLGQIPIAPCFPPRAEPRYIELDSDEDLEHLCQGAMIQWVRVGSSSYGYAEITVRCELQLAAVRIQLPHLALRSPIIDVQLHEARTAALGFRDGGYWGGERVQRWEVTSFHIAPPDPPIRHLRHRILGSRGSTLEIESRLATVIEVWG